MSILKEPLFHFFLLGVAIFGWFSYLNPSQSEPASGDQIVVDMQDINRLIDQFQSTWQRPPTPQELEELQEAFLRQEVLVREARALGLDWGDSIIRSRLAQKMEFLTLSLAQASEPDDATLQAHLAENSARFLRPERVAFQQVAMGPSPDAERINEVLDALNGGADPALFAGPSMLPNALPLSSPQKVDATMGRGFHAALIEMPEGQWVGPVPSGFGYHLVWIESREPAHLPAFDDIREEVLFDWRSNLKSDLSEAQFDTLKEKYDLITPSPEDITRRLNQ
ncbi:peptidyl-prolyl cis-trans isomerase [Ruegeria arenilitoris]|uniref:peptidylprolyl isomerase n=1 Tax=Ruegeria arenilitoris TaxID=1173585 RepID=UPI00147D6284|nr:peptidylprolyl isomerase [Ruegeria arenilitoris]